MRPARNVPHTFVIAAVILLICFASASAQFEGKTIKIKGKPVCEGFRCAKDTVVVWGENSYGVFSVNWNRREIYFVRVTDTGRKKGTVKTPFVGDSSSITAIDALWNGDNFVLAFNYTLPLGGDGYQYVYLVEVNERGKVLGDPVKLPDTRAAKHFAFAWNGKYYGLAYWQYLAGDWSSSPIYFQRYAADLASVGKRKLLMKKDGIVDIGVASSKGEFGVAWHSDIQSEHGKAYLARFKKNGKQVGKNKTFKRPGRIYQMRLKSNGKGYVAVFARGEDQEFIELCIFNNKFRLLKNPIAVNQDTADDHFNPCVALLDGIYWVFWESSLGWLAPADQSWGVTAGQVDSNGTVLASDNRLSYSTTTIQEYPRSAAAGSKGVLLAYHRFVPNNWTTDKGELRLRFMPK